MGQPMFPFFKEAASHPESSDSELEVGWRCSHSESCVHLGGVMRQCKMLNKKEIGAKLLIKFFFFLNTHFSIVKAKTKELLIRDAQIDVLPVSVYQLTKMVWKRLIQKVPSETAKPSSSFQYVVCSCSSNHGWMGKPWNLGRSRLEFCHLVCGSAVASQLLHLSLAEHVASAT